ncbi:hypothetical protein DPEC_G00231570 [Dallia pectoralis]|uniref:Uncharacterized protein n=1 Tax=Dallia pectoralis TaxID=75939 RepID=A0ACC2FX32_DALPE|nr:hypothetical protein DPEC_G00231570 [Dallia pectoralis]
MAKFFNLSSFLFTRMVEVPCFSIGGKICQSKTWASNGRTRGIRIHAASQSNSQKTNTSEDKVTIHFINQAGIKATTSVTEGETLLDVVVKKNLDISGFGACEGTLACSTCHCIFDKTFYENLEPMVDEEMDMLDLAYGLTKTSRLGCQVTVRKWMDGMTVEVPQETRDLRGANDS